MNALTAVLEADRCPEDGMYATLPAGRRCTRFASDWDREASWVARQPPKGVLTLKGQLSLGAVPSCSWIFKEELPLEGEETMAQVAARLFSAGPRRLSPVRTTYFE